jgi:Tfp pilus assembly protein PilF
MEVAMKSASLFTRSKIKHVAAVALLAAGLAGCGGGISPEMITYNHRAYREQGIEKFDKADYVNAASSFKEALRQEPGDYTSRYYLGECYDKMGHPQQAIEEYRTTLTSMVHSLEGKGDVQTHAKVLEALAQAIAHEPDRTGDIALIERQERTPENAVLLARISRYSGDADTALVHYQEAQQIDPASQPIAKEYGIYLEQLGQTKRADWQLRHAYAMNTHDEEVAAALRRLGVVPGPSLKTEDQLEKPFLPVGPLPEVDLSTSSKTTNSAPSPQPQPAGPGPVGNSTSPRD